MAVDVDVTVAVAVAVTIVVVPVRLVGVGLLVHGAPFADDGGRAEGGRR
jgi:hypothetical protein